jgi:hypothetical protein
MPKIAKVPASRTRISKMPGFTRDEAQRLVDKSRDRNLKWKHMCSRRGCRRALQTVVLDRTTGCYVPVCSHAECANPDMKPKKAKQATV